MQPSHCLGSFGFDAGRVGQQTTTGSGSSATRSHILNRISMGSSQKRPNLSGGCGSISLEDIGVESSLLAVLVATSFDDVFAILGRYINSIIEMNSFQDSALVEVFSW
jgi:hypothetical protein